jgi:AraC-like DNA-binding protein
VPPHHVHIFGTFERFLRPHHQKPLLSPQDQQFLEQFREIVEQHLGDTEFTTTVAAATLGMSRMHLHRKVRALTGHSTHEHIQTMRLDKARAMLSQPLSLVFIAHSFGFKSSSHFTKAFKKQFGGTPSAFRSKSSNRHSSF